MNDPVTAMAARLAAVERRLHGLETAPRALLTTISDGDFIVEGGGSVVVRDGGGVLINDGGTLALIEGDIGLSGAGGIVLSDGGGIDVNDGGGVNVNDGGGVNVNDGGGITVADGGTVEIDGTATVAGTIDVDGTATVDGTVSVDGTLEARNPDDTGTVLGTVNNERVAPLSVAAFTPAHFTVSSSGVANPLVRAVMSLGRNRINGFVQIRNVSGSVDVSLKATAVGGAHDGSPTSGAVVDSWEAITSNTTLTGPWTVPNTLWSPNGHPGGSLVLFELSVFENPGSPGSTADVFVPANGHLREVLT